MTDKERDAAAAAGAEGATDEDAAGEGELDETDEFEDDEAVEVEEETEEVDPGFAATPVGLATAAPGVVRGRRLRSQPTTVAAPTVSERAVHVDDRFSSWYVIALLAVFGVILANAILFGHGGFASGLLATPTPIATPSPTVASAPPSAAPSESAAPSSAASPSSSASSSASAGPSSSVSAAPASSAPASVPAAS